MFESVSTQVEPSPGAAHDSRVSQASVRRTATTVALSTAGGAAPREGHRARAACRERRSTGWTPGRRPPVDRLNSVGSTFGRACLSELGTIQIAVSCGAALTDAIWKH